jgi:hypothetical protein
VGCGNGALLELLKSTNEVVGVDASADGIAASASRGIQSYCMDPSSEPLPDESFDILVCLRRVMAWAWRAAGRFPAFCYWLWTFSGTELPRIFEVGWVGQTEGPVYRARGRIVKKLANSFRMNEVVRRHSAAELALIYRQSEIVVNVGRDDYRQDANVRTFEALAAGALLVTSLPSELSAIGFQDGAHFVGYGSETEIPGLVRAYLADEAARRRIAEAGRELVLREHTYDRRVDALLAFINDMEKKRCSPARVWTEERVRLAYLDYFAGNGALECAAAELPAIARHRLVKAAVGTAILARAWGRRIPGRIRSRLAPR